MHPIANDIHPSTQADEEEVNLDQEQYQPLQIDSAMSNQQPNMSHDIDLESSEILLEHEKKDHTINTAHFHRKCCILCRHTVDVLQSIVLPQRCCASTEGSRVHLIQGLDRVVFGTKAASECVVICGIKPVRYLWYMLSGSLCDALQLLIDLFLNTVVSISDPSVCWILGFAISIIPRHSSHRYLVFGDYVGGYWRSLSRMYAGYSIIIVISTVFNVVMTRDLKFSHYFAWFITLLWTGVVNYFILKYLWNFGSSNSVGGGSNMSMAQKGTSNIKSPRRD